MRYIKLFEATNAELDKEIKKCFFERLEEMKTDNINFFNKVVDRVYMMNFAVAMMFLGLFVDSKTGNFDLEIIMI